MFSAKQLDQVSDVVGTMSMPEVLYGFNRFYVANPSKDILLEFAPIEALSLASYAKREAMISKLAQPEEGQQKERTLEQVFERLNLNYKGGEY